jgi:PAS domain S-box-containing protein
MGIGPRLWTDRRRFTTALVVHVALPATYIITGWLGLLLAISPGYATAVFVPAGIAVAAAFIFGPVSLPGTFAASFLLNTLLGLSIGPGVDIVKLATAAAIAFASALQAGVGGAVLRRAVGYPAPLDNPRHVISFVLLAPVICLTSATISTSSMLALGVVAPGELAINWLTWWIGDSLGVLVATPLVLVVAGQPRSLWRLRFWYVAVPMILCFALFVSIFVRVRSWEERESLIQFRLRSQQLADTISAALSQQTLSLEQLSSSLVNRPDAVSRKDFHGLAHSLLERFPAIQAVEWAPRIAGDRRQAFETAERSYAPGFVIRERSPSGQIALAADRAEYYPVTYIEPSAGNEAAEGFDLASNPNRRHALDASLAHGAVAATTPTRLVQETGAEAGVLLICPVSSGPSGPGVVLIVLRMDSFVRTVAHPFELILGVRLVDLDSASPLSDALAGRPPAYESAFDFAMRRYLVQTSPSSRYLAEHWAWQSWTVLAGGVLCTGLLGALLMLGTGYAYRVRTNEEELDAIVNRTPFMLTRCSRDLHYRFVSNSYAAMIGKKSENVAGKPIAEIMGEQGFSTILPHVEKVLQGERVEYESEVQFAGVGSRLLHVTYTPERDAAGEVQGWIASINDISDRRAADNRIAADLKAMTLLREVGNLCAREGFDATKCLQAILDAGMTVAGAAKGDIQLLDPGSGTLTIAAHRGFAAPFLSFFAHVRDDASACAQALRSAQRVIVEDVTTSEIYIGQPSQQVLLDAGVQAVISTPLTSSAANTLGMLSVHFDRRHWPEERELHLLDLLARQAGDYLERKRSEDIQKTLVSELRHRNNNLLAVVQAIASQTLSGKGFSPEARKAFEGRLQALARATRLLTKSNWNFVSLNDLVRSELAAFSGRSSVEGADTLLSAQVAQNLALGLHELATNAVKYGALSNGSGSISVSWRATGNGDGRSLTFKWEERGGPAATTPAHGGYGTALLNAVFRNVHLDYLPSGLVCEFDMRLGDAGREAQR